MNIYESDWDGRFPVLRTTSNRAPDGSGWTSALWPYIKHTVLFSCPTSPSGDSVHMGRWPKQSYSFNRRLSGMKETSVRKPEEVAALWDTVSSAEYCNNTNGDHVWRWGDPYWPKPGDYVAWPDHADKRCRDWPEPAKPRHHGVNNVCYADGHAKPCEPGIVPRISPK
jgi:prepilin-type processing-associated H-X9-DG protein